MKSIKAFAVLMLIVATTTMSAQTKEKWKQLNSYHDVISRTFHPAEEGNLTPIKAYSETLMQTADRMTKEIPAEYNTKKITDLVGELSQKSKEVHELVLNKASDAAITKALTEAHDIFHEITGLCSGEKH